MLAEVQTIEFDSEFNFRKTLLWDQDINTIKRIEYKQILNKLWLEHIGFKINSHNIFKLYKTSILQNIDPNILNRKIWDFHLTLRDSSEPNDILNVIEQMQS